MPMRLFLILISALFIVSGARSQHHHFFYIQSDQQQLFYVKIGNEVLSASSGGFLIIPKLKDSAFDMIVGFPKNQFPEYRFRIAQVKKDRGMALKNFGEKGWGLFDFQTLEITMGEKISKPEPLAPKADPPVTSDAFTAILSTVIDDPGLMATPLVMKEPASSSIARNAVAIKEVTPEKQDASKTGISLQNSGPEKKEALAVQELATVKQETEKPLTSTQRGDMPKAGPPPSANKEMVNTAVIVAADKGANKLDDAPVGKTPGTDTVLQKATSNTVSEVHVGLPKISKLSEQVHDSGLVLVYTDQSVSGKVDTITVLLDKEKMQPAGPVKSQTLIVPAVSVPDTLRKSDQKIAQESVTLLMETKDVETSGKTDTTSTINRKNFRLSCSKTALEKDVTGLRRRMVGLKDEDDMVALALKDFKLKCYTTEQVKHVSFVFVRDEGRYKLLDAAYPYVYDPDNFTSLESLLSDPYFIHRFRALVTRPADKVP
jgi:hypothetical protein